VVFKAASDALAAIGTGVASANPSRGRIVSRVAAIGASAVSSGYNAVLLESGVQSEVQIIGKANGLTDVIFIDRAVLNGMPDTFTDSPQTQQFLRSRAERFFRELGAALPVTSPFSVPGSTL